MTGILGYASYLPRYRLQRTELGALLGTPPGKGARVVASFDEDSTTMAVAAGAAVLRSGGPSPASLYFATTSPAYFDKTNATAVHAGLGLPASILAADVAGSARSAVAAWRAAAASRGLAVFADVRVGRPGSADERGGGDGAAAFLFGDGADAIAEVLAERSSTLELLDRWRLPGSPAAEQWEERFGLEAYLPLAREVAQETLNEAGLAQADHVVVVSPNSGVVKQGPKAIAGAISTSTSPIGHAGAADLGIGLADALDRAEPGQSILVVSVADGCDAILLRATAALPRARQARPLRTELEPGIDVPYVTYLSWRGLLDREPPRRPEPERPAGPPSRRAGEWKFAFAGARCQACGFTHLPPQRVCKQCGHTDEIEPVGLATDRGTVATYTVDRLAFSPSPPLIDAVVDFDGGGRYTLEVADAVPDDLAVGTRVGLTFRKLFTAGNVHNYFWKARLVDEAVSPAREAAVTAGGRA
ncbi:OB-fold domain-containing protein [Amycolatopsis echigonensis]|uniref:Hydroxymethylglutaryl-CoA synthase family protein n=1 Tax=Amycolatopsis echigonensis TaxID=2576905 RepID=A0A8E1W782_9PSEU|nr:OB-fold domain-containing protein [Amycolatopsis echigonensis]MBB2504942.1 hydroxymethylglutaryl-CoA synthase family protein [Amycolatopsis echigonensis]